MSQSPDQNPKASPAGQDSNIRGSSRSGIMLFAALALLLVGILSSLVLTRLDRVDREVSRLSAQVEQANRKVDAASAKAASALDQASQAQQSALKAANERNQAEEAEAQFQQQAQQAQQQLEQAKQQVLEAQQQAEQAQQKAEEYRKAREAELTRLQQALGQIASTRRNGLGLVMTLGSKSIRFAFDKSTLRPEDKEVLSRIAGILSLLKGYQIYVYGYTDDIGTKEYNLRLSDWRAKAVYDYLIKNGLDPSIMSTKGFGEADPLVPGSSPQARAINRRVEIGIVDSTIKPLPPQDQ
jgi:outer membrane protein OmpA-like peptidoglycan-associated protein